MRKYTIILVIGVWCTITSLPAQVLPADSLTLVDLYNNTSGSSWTNISGWLQPGVKVSSWTGVTITGNRVVSLNLINKNLTGPIPSSISNLSALAQLNLRQNKLSGTIPVSLTQLSALKSLILDNNQLTGSIPTTIGLLVNLETLNLDNNQLTGIIPIEVTDLIKLTGLSLSGNQLTGSIPSTINKLQALQRLQLSKNQLSGNIPDVITNITTLKYLDLRNNTLTGTIPSQIGNIVGLTDLYLGNDEASATKNKFNGHLPANLSNLTFLVNFTVNRNELEGDVPVLNSPGLQLVDLSFNKFTYLPDMDGLNSIQLFDVRYNYFTPGDLYYNATSLGASFLYDPQESYKIDSVETSHPVGNQYTIIVPGGATSSSYAWTFKDRNNNVTSKGTFAIPTFTIPSVNKSTMGIYLCEVTDPNITGTFTYAHVVNATANISGVLKADEINPALSGEMRLLRVTLTGAYDTVGYIPNVNPTDGSYNFDNVLLADYLLNGFANPVNYPNAIPTWSTKNLAGSILWEDADVISLNIDTTVNIISAYEPDLPPTGQGIITGIFYEALSDAGGKVNAVGRVARSPVSVRRIQQSGRGAEEILVFIDYTFTDENGEFEFTQLEEAEYLLNIQYPGYPMDEISFIRIPIGNTLFDRHIFIEAYVLNNKIYVRKLVITGWEEEEHTLQAFPNPTLEYLFVTSKHDQNIHFKLIDADGKELAVHPQRDTMMNRWIIDVQNLKPGAYVLQMEGKNKVEELRILIQ